MKKASKNDFFQGVLSTLLFTAIFLGCMFLLFGCADLGKARGENSQAIANQCAREAYGNDIADAYDWIPVVGISMGNNERKKTFRACVERHGNTWEQ